MLKFKRGVCVESSLGFILKDLLSSEINWRIITQLNSIKELSSMIFLPDKCAPFIPVKCPVMSLADAWGFRGTLVAVDYEMVGHLRSMFCPLSRIFYAQRPEKADLTGLKVVTRTPEYAKTLGLSGTAAIDYKLSVANLCQLAGII